MRRLLNRCKEVGVLVAIACAVAVAGQEKAPQQPQPPASGAGEERGERNFGTITSVGVDRFEMKRRDGSSLTVMVDDQTHYRQGQQDIQLEDLKPGDPVGVRGRSNAHHEFVASLVRRITAEEQQRFQNAGDRVFGEIVTIEQSQIKVRNPRGGEKTVLVNGQTVMRKEGQPIALKDLKVGDHVFILGKETGGQFVATRLFTGQFRGQGRREADPEH